MIDSVTLFGARLFRKPGTRDLAEVQGLLNGIVGSGVDHLQ